MRRIDRVVLPVLGGTGGADQAIRNAVAGQPRQRLLDPRLLVQIQLLARHIHRCYPDLRIQGFKQRVFELTFAIQIHHLLLQLAVLVDLQRHDSQGVLRNDSLW